MADRNGLKGNPASKRISNVAAKNKRARSWLKREREKEANRVAQTARAKANKTAELTPWQVAKAARHARRHSVTLAA